MKEVEKYDCRRVWMQSDSVQRKKKQVQRQAIRHACQGIHSSRAVNIRENKGSFINGVCGGSRSMVRWASPMCRDDSKLSSG